ncbi:hypothetical protein KA977_06320 [Candidatus Dependentiae bacterium]|nr:hypothetical protein [Candidatus Dependentiae bacterium]
MNLKKSAGIIFFVMFIYVTALQTQPLEKIKTDISGFIDIGYYSPENSDKSFIIDGAGLTFSGEKADLSGVLEINYKDSEDTYFVKDMVYLNKIAVTITQKNGGAIIGKFPNLNLPRQSDVWSRKTLSFNMTDMILGKHNPVGVQYYIASEKINFNLGYFNGFGFASAPVYPNSKKDLLTLCQNPDYKKNGKNDIFASLTFKSGTGISLKTGAMFSSLSGGDLAELQNLSGNFTLNDDKKDMWYFSFEQSSKQMFFNASYYNYNISEIKNNILDIVLNYKLNDSINLSGSFSYLKYKNAGVPSIILSDRKQYTASLSYEMKNLLLGYEYVINKEDLPDGTVISGNNDIHSMKAVYKF